MWMTKHQPFQKTDLTSSNNILFSKPTFFETLWLKVTDLVCSACLSGQSSLARSDKPCLLCLSGQSYLAETYK